MTPDQDLTRTSPPLDAEATHTSAEPATVTRDAAEAIRDLLTDTGQTASATSTPHMPDALPGFVLERELGVGGMGVVYLARQVGLNRPVALKLVKPSAKVDTKALIRFLAEAEVVAAIRHPHVVEVYQYGEHGGKPYMVLEFCPGGDLTSLTKSTPTRDAAWFRKVADLMAKVADGVNAAHGQGIVHRDLKPHNVFLTADGTPKVADFGLAKRGLSSDLTNTDAVMGTPAYMAPEQAGGGTKFVGPEADVWALGVMLYELCCGERPIDTSGPVLDALTRVANPSVPALHAKAPSVPPDLALIVHKCLSPDPRDRYATAGGLATDLRNWLDGKPISARPAGVVEQAVKWAKRKPTLAGLYAAGLFGVVLAGVAVGLTVLWQEAKTAHSQADIARAGEEVARVQAENARKGEEEARKIAETAREKLAAVEYGRTVQVAYQECLNGNVGGAMTLLEGTRPDLRGWEWRYVHTLCNGQVLTLNGHPGQVLCVAWSSDGSKVISGGMDKTARISDAQTGRELLLLKGHTDPVFSATFSPDGRRVLTSCQYGVGPGMPPRPADRSARIWDATTGEQLAVLKGHSSELGTTTFSPDGTRVLTTVVDGARIWDAANGEPIRTLRFKPAESRAAPGRPNIASSGDAVGRWTPDGKHVALLLEHRVTLWDATSGEMVREFETGVGDEIEGDFFALALSADGSKLAVEFGTEVFVWDVGSRKLLARAPGELGRHGMSRETVPFNRDGTKLVTCSGVNGTAQVWDVTTGKVLLTLKGKGRQLTGASFTPDGTRIVTTERDGHVAHVWDASTGEHLVALTGHTRRVECVAISPDGTKVATGTLRDAAVRIWVLPTPSKAPPPKVLTWAPDGRRFLSQVNGSSVVIDPSTQSPAVLEESASPADWDFRWHFRPDGKLVCRVNHGFRPWDFKAAAPPEQPAVVVWDAATGKKLCAVAGSAVALATNHDSSRFLTTFDDGTVRIWDTTGREVTVLRGHSSRIRNAWWSPDGSRVITVVGPGRRGTDPVPENPLRVWDAATGREITTLKVGPIKVRETFGGRDDVAWSPDGTRIAIRVDLQVRVWDARTGLELLANPISGRLMTWSPDGAHVVCADGSKVCIRDSSSGEVVRTLVGHLSTPVSASFSPDETRLVTTSSDNTARVWDVRTGSEVLTLRCAPESYEPAVWSKDGARFVTRSSDPDMAQPPEMWDATPTDPRFRTPAPNEPRR